LKFSPRAWFLLGILYISYIVYGTLLPFNFSFEFIQANLQKIEWLGQYPRPYLFTKSIDAIANIFFFIPLGIIIFNAHLASSHRRNFLIHILLATLSGFTLSLIIEFLQLLTVERKTSLIDLVMNTIGCFSGAFLGYLFNQILVKVTQQKIDNFVKNLPPIILIVPFLLLSFFISEKFSLNFLKPKQIESTHFNWEFIFKPVWIWLVLYVYFPIGTIVTHAIRRKYANLTSLLIGIIGFFSALALSSSVELMKYIGGITATPLDNLFFGIFGILIGIAFSEVLRNKYEVMEKSGNQRSVNILILIYGLLGLIVLYKSAYPFKFNFSKSYIFDKMVFSLLSTYSFIPFNGLLKLFIYSAQNILLFLPIGIVLCEIETYLNMKKKIFLLLTFFLFFILLPFGIQILNQNLTPFLYEILTNILGIFTGYFIWHGFRRVDQSLERRL